MEPVLFGHAFLHLTDDGLRHARWLQAQSIYGQMVQAIERRYGEPGRPARPGPVSRRELRRLMR